MNVPQRQMTWDEVVAQMVVYRNERDALQAEVDEQREDYLAKCSELEAVHEHYRIITVKLQAELEAARKDAAHLLNILSFARSCIGHPDNIAMLDAAIGATK